MTFRVHRCPSAAAFLALVEPFLLREEAAHNLILGIAAQVRAEPSRYEGMPFFAVVTQDGDAVGAAFRTPPYNLVLSQMPRNALPAFATALGAEYDTLPGVLAPAELAAMFAVAWQRRTGQSFARRRGERIFQLDMVTLPRDVAGAARWATEADHDLLIAWGGAFQVEAGFDNDPPRIAQSMNARLKATREAGGLWLWEDGGQPVSLAGYSGPTAHGIRIGPVYTPPEHRGRGYASANVAALSQWLLDGGRQFCFLFTDLANPTSNKIYQQIGYHAVCDVDEYAFLPATSIT